MYIYCLVLHVLYSDKSLSSSEGRPGSDLGGSVRSIRIPKTATARHNVLQVMMQRLVEVQYLLEAFLHLHESAFILAFFCELAGVLLGFSQYTETDIAIFSSKNENNHY